MEPISTTVIATLLLTKAVEKIGEEFGEMALHQVGRLRQLIQRKDPDTAIAIHTVTQRPELSESKPAEYGMQALAQRLQLVANADPEISEAMKSVASTVQERPQSVQNLLNTNINRGIIAPGGVFTGDINF